MVCNWSERRGVVERCEKTGVVYTTGLRYIIRVLERENRSDWSEKTSACDWCDWSLERTSLNGLGYEGSRTSVSVYWSLKNSTNSLMTATD